MGVFDQNRSDTFAAADGNRHCNVDALSPNDAAATNEAIHLRHIKRYSTGQYGCCEVCHRDLHTATSFFVEKALCLSDIDIQGAVYARIRRRGVDGGGGNAPWGVELVHQSLWLTTGAE